MRLPSKRFNKLQESQQGQIEYWIAPKEKTAVEEVELLEK